MCDPSSIFEKIYGIKGTQLYIEHTKNLFFSILKADNIVIIKIFWLKRLNIFSNDHNRKVKIRIKVLGTKWWFYIVMLITRRQSIYPCIGKASWCFIWNTLIPSLMINMEIWDHYSVYGASRSSFIFLHFDFEYWEEHQGFFY